MAQLTAIILPGIFVLLLLAEQNIPLRRRTRPLLPRLVKNLILTAAVFLVGSLVVRSAGLGASVWTTERGIGWCL